MSVPQMSPLEFTNRTNLHWIALLLTLALGFGALVLPRRWVPPLLLTMACFVPDGQRLVLSTLDFSLLRILVLFGWGRVLARGDWKHLSWNAIDTLLVLWVLARISASLMLHATAEAFTFTAGAMFDATGIYFFCRCMVTSWKELGAVSRSLAYLSLPVFIAFMIERASGRNLFALFGGVPELTEVRDGRIRCQGAFSHSILAGCFWASALPLISALWWSGGRARILSILGTFCATAIIYLTASSTPAFAAFAVALAGGAFLLRKHMTVLRFGVLVYACILQLVMNGPLWHLFARVDVVGGSTGWHRFLLVDAAIRQVGEWWLFGVKNTGHWGPGLQDVTNQYVIEAIQGGLLGLGLFLAILGCGFRAVGKAWRIAWPEKKNVALCWALGVSLFANTISFLGNAYVGQISALWFLTLACLASLQAITRSPARLHTENVPPSGSVLAPKRALAR